MTKKPLRLLDYLEHMEEAARHIEEYTVDLDYVGFLVQRMPQDAVIRNLEIIGEAAKNIIQRFPEVAEQSHEIPWKALYGMRNALSHGYFQVDLERIWQTIENDLPHLQSQVNQLIEQSTCGNDNVRKKP